MKKYRIKNNGMFVYDKMTCRDMHTNKIKYIDWKSAVAVEERDASIFIEDEVKFMKDKYGKIKVMEVK